MNSDLHLALEDCLALLQTGADLETCLGKYPADADRLRPLLAAAIQARSLADDRVPQEVMRRGRAKFLNQAAEIREEQRSRRRQGAFSFQRVLRFGFSLLLAVVILVGAGGTGLVNASSSSLPGDGLYGVKLTWENIRLKLTSSEEERLTLEEEFEQERLTEVGGLLSRERQERVKFPGRVDSMQEGSLLVSGVTVLVTPETRVDGQIIPGAWVEVEGRTTPGGVVNASRIRVEDAKDAPGEEQGEDSSGSSGKGGSEPINGKDGDKTSEGSDNPGSGSESAKTPDPAGDQPREQDRNSQKPLDLEGEISAASGSSFTVNGKLFNLDSRSEVRGSLMVGAFVRIRAFLDSTGKLIVTRAEVLGSPTLESGSGGLNDSSGSGKNEPTRTPKPEETHED